MKNLLPLIGALLCLWALECGHAPTIAKGGSTTEIIGSLRDEKGAPATSATVYLRPSDYLPSFTAKIATRLSFKSLDSAVTDSSGTFFFDSIAPGTYTLECLDGEPGNGALIDSVVIDNPDSKTDLGTNTLKPLGAISGKIQLPESLNASRVRVMAYGLDRIILPNSLGAYSIPGLAEGAYSLRIQVLAGEGMDTSSIAVSSGVTSVRNNFVLPGADKISAKKTLGDVTIDGLLNESDWGSAQVIGFVDRAASENIVQVRVLWDSVFLFVGYEVYDTLLGIDSDGEVFGGDLAEFYLDPLHDATAALNDDDLQFAIDIADSVRITRDSVYLQNTISSKTKRMATGYSMEISIPWSLIGAAPTPGLVMGALFAISDKDGADISQFDWLGLIHEDWGVLKRPNLWGDLILKE